jgi:Tfp pilus assembly protein PilN
MSTTTAVRAGTLPRVNLLPQEISESVRFRNAQAGMLLAAVLAFVGVAMLTVMASSDVNDAQTALTASQNEGAQLQAQVNSYADVPKLYAQVATAQAQLTTAMGQEVRYSFLLKDLSLSIPANVWLTEIQVTQPVDSPNSVTGAWGDPGVASVTFQGGAVVLNDVASWLDALARENAYSDPFVTNAAIGGATKTSFTFTSNVIVNSKGLSNRYAAKAGS